MDRIERARKGSATKLDLSALGLTHLPDAVGPLTQLAELYLGFNELSALPDWLGNLTALTTLDVGGNGLSVLPQTFENLTGLTILDLGGNRLSKLPDWLGNLTALTTLNLGSNELSALPQTFSNLTALTTLNLEGNGLSALPDWLGILTGLTTLNLGFNGLSALPQTLGNLAGLTTLHLSNNGLSDLPDWLGNLTTLTTLSLGSNRLSALPQTLGNLTALTTLHLSGNELSKLPDWLGNLTSLTTLRLDRNELSALPDWLGNLTALTTLNLSFAGLSALPDWLGNLTALTTLNLSGNELSKLPDWLGNLTDLTTLDLGGNRLSALPQTLGNLADLTTLRLDRNELSALPEWLGNFTALTTLNLGGNRLISPPPEVVAGGAQAIVAFLRASREGGTRRLWRSKLVLVGQGRAGKTSLVAALDGRAFDSEQASTVGLALTELPLHDRLAVSDFKLRGIQSADPEQGQPSAPDMRLSVWDFGGQEIYHATHQFFLTDRSLFLVVWDPNQGYDNSRLTYWLETVTARAPGAPILLVATHGTQRPADLPLGDLQRRFPAIKHALSVDSATGLGIERLRDLITQQAAQLPLMGAPWPTTWAAGADALRALPGTHTPSPAARALLADRKLADSEQDELLSALTVLGDVLHYPDDERLTDTVVLQPQWLNTRIARILDSHAVAARGGQLLWDDVNSEWADIDPAMREHFLTMMDRYDISYRIHDRDAPVAALVTALLPWERPDLSEHWPEQYTGPQSGLTYQLNLIPPGIPTWFITRTRRFTLRHWRTGALLRDPDSRALALIQADPQAGTLHLTIRSPKPGAFLGVLLGELAHSLRRYPGLHPTRLVHCPCTRQLERCVHRYEYTDLVRYLLDRDSTVKCPKSRQLVPIAPMLDGIDATNTELANLGISGGNPELHAKLDQIQREIGALRTASVEAAGTRCPSVFTLRTVRRSPLRTRYELHVCCEHPDAPHEIDPRTPAGKDAAYDVRTLRTWAETIAPTAQTAFAAAKTAAPLIALLLTGIAPHLHGSARKQVHAASTHLGKIPGHIPLLDQTPGTPALREVTTPTRFATTDADYRELHALFTALDSTRTTRRRLAGLSATQDPNGHTIYLCPIHAPNRT